jgi:hypothetical protein
LFGSHAVSKARFIKTAGSKQARSTSRRIYKKSNSFYHKNLISCTKHTVAPYTSSNIFFHDRRALFRVKQCKGVYTLCNTNKRNTILLKSNRLTHHALLYFAPSNPYLYKDLSICHPSEASLEFFSSLWSLFIFLLPTPTAAQQSTAPSPRCSAVGSHP